MEPLVIRHFSDLLCVWAYVSQVRCDELLEQFPGRVRFAWQSVQVFGDVPTKIETLWKERGGLEAYAAHVREIVEGFGHVPVHPEVWLRATPQSSLPGHLLLAGLRALEAREEVAPDTEARAAWALREAFFQECADVSDRATLLSLAERVGAPSQAVTAVLDRGEAHALLSQDLADARDLGVQISPTLVFNEGRQRLAGNVGYRVLEANVRELLERPDDTPAWC